MQFLSSIIPRDQESLYTEKMQNMQQTLVEERDKLVQNASQQRSMLEDSLTSAKTEEQRLRMKLSEAEEVGLFVCLSVFLFFFLLRGRCLVHNRISSSSVGRRSTRRRNPASETGLSPRCSSPKLLSNMTYLLMRLL